MSCKMLESFKYLTQKIEEYGKKKEDAERELIRYLSEMENLMNEWKKLIENSEKVSSDKEDKTECEDTQNNSLLTLNEETGPSQKLKGRIEPVEEGSEYASKEKRNEEKLQGDDEDRDGKLEKERKESDNNHEHTKGQNYFLNSKSSSCSGTSSSYKYFSKVSSPSSSKCINNDSNSSNNKIDSNNRSSDSSNDTTSNIDSSSKHNIKLEIKTLKKENINDCAAALVFNKETIATKASPSTLPSSTIPLRTKKRQLTDHDENVDPLELMLRIKNERKMTPVCDGTRKSNEIIKQNVMK